MQIVSQSVPIFHFQFLALPAPKLPIIAGLLCAPKIAGLLVARVPSSPPMKRAIVLSTKVQLAPEFFINPATSTDKLIEVFEYTHWLLTELSRIMDPQQYSEYVRINGLKYRAIAELHRRLPDDMRFQPRVTRRLPTPEEVTAKFNEVVGGLAEVLYQTSTSWEDRPSRRYDAEQAAKKAAKKAVIRGQ